ncbi:phage GP46 family protein [Methylomonas sp. MS20]|uniref:phage GP46 family protein n=1 Tax=unclassified Methylomonas TaxID=2608980 RepID=UPI0028A43315|nr:phage GP46 family protein [Methylomonas sp. MV1]MDT4328549.1 phage GP46 family protein [Methylomonas sp. MV1]
MLKLIQVDNGVFDLAFDDPVLVDEHAALETLVFTALFTDAEAPDRRVPDRYERRGWWADPAVGTGLWYLRRQGLGDAARREALWMVKQSLIDHGLTDVTVTEDPAGAGNVSGVFLLIAGSHNGRTFNMSVPL